MYTAKLFLPSLLPCLHRHSRSSLCSSIATQTQLVQLHRHRHSLCSSIATDTACLPASIAIDAAKKPTMTPHPIPSFQISIPPFFICPISLQLMEDPVTLSTGQTFDRSSIEKWLDEGHLICPLTRQPLCPDDEPIPNHTLRRMIQGWCVANKSKGIQRIATPRARASLEEVRQLVSEIKSGEPDLSSLNKLSAMAREHSRTRRRLLEAGMLSALFSYLAARSLPHLSPRCSLIEKVEEVLSILAFLCNTENSHSNPTSEQVSVVAWFLVEGSIDAKLNAAMLLNSVDLSQDMKKMIGERKGVIGSLVAMVKEELYPRVSMAGMKLLSEVVSSMGNRTRAVEAGAVEGIVEILPGADKRRAELGLGILEALCLCADGRAAACNHALSIPIIIRLTNTVSEKATEHVLQILRSVLTMTTTGVNVKKMAVEAGAIHQLLIAPQRCNNSVLSRKLALHILRALSEVVDLGACYLHTVKL